MIAEEGYLPFGQYRTWYRSVGAAAPADRLPLLVLHGGPGSPHDYLEPLEALAEGGRQVVFYDQLGCGRSDAPDDLSLYTFGLFCAEIDAVRRALGLNRLHIFGHSWGGMLALEYALGGPQGLAGLVLADTAASAPDWAAEGRRLLADLPAETQEIIRFHEETGTTSSEEYQKACRVFYHRYGSGRVHPRPECLARMKGKPGMAVYEYMWGPSEWLVTGTITDWDVSARLGEIHQRTLVLAGRHDHATPLLAERLAGGIPGSRLVIFEHSGHFPHLEETGPFLEEVSAFLLEADAAAGVELPG